MKQRDGDGDGDDDDDDDPSISGFEKYARRDKKSDEILRSRVITSLLSFQHFVFCTDMRKNSK